MRIAVWDHLPASLFDASVSELVGGTEFVSIPSALAAEQLLSGEVDVALVPTLTILRDTGAFDVLPAIAFSTWNFPFARLLLRGALGTPVTSLTVPGAFPLETLVARVVLREHYASAVDVRERDVLHSAEDDETEASLIIDSAPAAENGDARSLDLGQEWYELANYPMVWGLFACRAGEGSREMIVSVREAIIAIDEAREQIAAQTSSRVLQDFVSEQTRLRLDDLAVASLTELYNYVYYYGAVSDFTTIDFVSLDEPSDDTAADTA